MANERITSSQNPLVKQIARLQSSAKFRRSEGLFVAEGVRLCADAMLSGLRFSMLVISDSASVRYADAVDQLISAADKIFYVSDAVFSKISDTATPQGVIAVIKIADLVSQKPIAKGKYVALENIQDPSNLGAVARTAEAFGVSGIILTESGCDPFSPKALRASMGALFRIPVFIVENLFPFVSEFGTTYACVIDSDASPVGSIDFEPGSVVLIGNEGNGLMQETILSADKKVTIPMPGRAESLNAAVAASIMIWEMQRGFN